MRPLSVQEMISVWERGENHSPLDRALLLLQAGQPETSLQEIARLTVGERDRRLLQLREQTIGKRFSCFVKCPRCEEDLEFEFDTSQIFQAPAAFHTEPINVSADGFSAAFRLPNSDDLLEVLQNSASPEESQRRLLARCVVELQRDGQVLELDEAPETVHSKLCDLIGNSDPQADVQFSVQCFSCNKSWQATFDVASFFWKEIAIRARRALSEVHVLASSYGWKESDILSMSEARREFYLAMVSG